MMFILKREFAATMVAMRCILMPCKQMHILFCSAAENQQNGEPNDKKIMCKSY